VELLQSKRERRLMNDAYNIRFEQGRFLELRCTIGYIWDGSVADPGARA